MRLKNICKIGLVIAAAIAFLAPLKTSAQGGVGYDYFGVPNTIVLLPPTEVTGTATGTSNYVDRIGYAGVGNMSLFTCTNGGAGYACTTSIWSSPDLTNWTRVSYAQATNSTGRGIITNTTYAYSGTNTPSYLTCTNTNAAPAQLITPNIWTSGFSTPNGQGYGQQISFTNTNTITLLTGSNCQIGVNLDDTGRYISVSYTTTSNQTIGATILARKVY